MGIDEVLDEQMHDRIRNVGIPVAIGKPNMYKRAVICSMCTLITLLFLRTFVTIKEGCEVLMLCGSILVVYVYYLEKHDKFYMWLKLYTMRNVEPYVVIGYSNRVTLLRGKVLKYEVTPEEIEIRELTGTEQESYVASTTMAIVCKNGGEDIAIIYAEGLEGYAGTTLLAKVERASADMQVQYTTEIQKIELSEDENKDNESKDNEEEDNIA